MTMLKPLFLCILLLFIFSSCTEEITSEKAENDEQQPSDIENSLPEKETGPVKHGEVHTTAEAIRYNEERKLPIRFVLKLKQMLGVNIDRTSLSNAVKFDEMTVQKTAELQKTWFGASRYGLIDAQTYLKIQSELFSESKVHALVGPYSTPNGMLLRGLTPTGEVDESVYERCKDIIESYGGYFDTTPGIRNMLAIRGAVIKDDQILRTNTADLYFQNINETSPTAGSLIHFASGADLNPDSGVEPFDDVMLTIWKEKGETGPVYYVYAVPLSVDPGMQWTGKQDYDGTAHLRDGQYIGQLGRHGTSQSNHIYAVINACSEDIASFDIIAPGDRNSNLLEYEDISNWLVSSSQMRLTYSAMINIYSSQKYNGRTITASAASEVMRDFHHLTDTSDGILTIQEVETAEKILANRYPTNALLLQEYPGFASSEALSGWIDDHTVRYTDEECQILFGKSANEFYDESNRSSRIDAFKKLYIRFHDSDYSIGINIHTSPDDETSSQGCLNIPISSYRDFLYNLVDSKEQSEYLYTLIDGSKIEDII